MLFQPTNIVPDEVSGQGCVDITNDLVVSWQVNGDSPLVAYQITIYENNAASTQLYTTDKESTSEPFWGRDADGDIQRYSATIEASDLSTAGLSNGNEYKLLITQWWDSTNYVTQLTASVFITRAAPQVAIDAFSIPLTTKAYTFGATYYQEQGDAISGIRWLIAEANDKDNPLLDTGEIEGTGILKAEYDGFFTGVTYSVRCIVETQNNDIADTGWVDFAVEYSLDAPIGTASACQLSYTNAVFVQWDKVPNAYGYSVMRQRVGETRLTKVVDVGNTVGQIRDYEAHSNESYIYYVYPSGQVSYLSAPMVTGQVNVKFWFWTILEATESKKNVFTAIAAHYFKYSDGGIKEGAISNNNSPTIAKNFTRYPNRQGMTSNYKSGSLTGYVGSITSDTHEYSDTVKDVDSVMALSTSKNTLFLIDPKGHVLRIHTNGAISSQTQVEKNVMPQSVTVPWVEIGSAEGITLTSTPQDTFYPTDNIIFTVLSVNFDTGALIWSVPEGYMNGSRMSLNSAGELIQSCEGSFTEAEMELNTTTMMVTATLDE